MKNITINGEVYVLEKDVKVELSKKNIKDVRNCPYCQSELMGVSQPWGMSPEGWMQAKQNHDTNHVQN